MRTKIMWSLHDYCTSRCSYCPTRFWRGDTPRHINEYLAITKNIIAHFKSIDRDIDWTFTGGEPLDMIDFPMMLKLCKENGGDITLHSNGGEMWMDWWAIEPHITNLNLTYHYWQTPHLIKFILDTFHKNDKSVKVSVPIRPDHFDEDIQRAIDVETMHSITVSKTPLYHEADHLIGMFPYTAQQLITLCGETDSQEPTPSTYKARFEKQLADNPSFTGMLCNAGIDALQISHDGWATGSACNNRPLGNIWNPGFRLPSGPHKCGMMACMSASDQQIIKFYPT